MSDIGGKARLYAESAARVMDTQVHLARGSVLLGRRTKAQAADVCRRKAKSLAKEFWSRPYDSSEEAWTEHGPDKVFAAFLAEMLPQVSQPTGLANAPSGERGSR